MKANNGLGNTPERDDWKTPQKLWDELNKQYLFTHDCCANEDGSNSKCNVWSFDFLHENNMWTTDIAWMNPPFSKAYVMFEHFFKVVSKGFDIDKLREDDEGTYVDAVDYGRGFDEQEFMSIIQKYKKEENDPRSDV